MFTGLRSYIVYRRTRWTATRELRGGRRLQRGIEANFQDAAERARSDQEFRGGTLTGALRDRGSQR
jgi:hypothetical protein